MILVTVGMQLPFPRLVAAMDRLAPGLDEPVVAQVGPDRASYPNLDARARLTPAEFDAAARRARLLVGHAGIGTVLTARHLGKPLILFPRRRDLGEHRNDHQFATCRQLEGVRGLHVAWSEEDLARLVPAPQLVAASETPGPSHDALIGYLRDYIDQ